ncbi:TetR/AcrR family transcriptional regulator [Nocardia asteroides]|uniref:TetR/AcrR family transcriptional regulator n=1 Tax=Nocardia asteroides TaxID=1824 RepID=UPI0037C54C85
MARVASATGRYGGRSASERQAERRARFREAGLEAFGAGAGYRQTRLTDLCQAAGLSTRQFYQEYDTLEDLLGELHLHLDTIVEQHVLDEVARVDDLPLAGRASAMVRAYLSYVTRDPRCARIAFVEIAGVSARMDAQRRQSRARWVELMCALFDSFAGRGELAPRDYRLTAATFVGAVDGLMRDWTAGWVDATVDQLTDELLRMLLGGLGATGTPAATEPVAVTAAPVRRRPRDRRATILRAASDAFAEHGYHRTSMADIATAVGITSGALYRHFRTKQELLGSCLREGLDLILERVDTACADGAPADAALPALVRVSLETRGLARLWQLEFRNLTPVDRMGVLARSVRLTHRIGAAVQARRPGITAADRDALGWVVLSVVTSPSNHRTRLPDDAFARVLDAAVDAVIDAGVSRGEAVTGATGSGDRPADADSEPRNEQLIAAAAQLFSERGFAAVSIEDIGTSVGVRGPALYHHFESKSDLLDEIIDRNNRWIQQYTERALAEGGDPRDSLRLLLRYYVLFARDRTDLVGTAVSEARNLPAAAAARYRRIHREGIIGWARLLQSVRPELSMPTARVLIHAVTTVVNDAVRNPRLTRRPDLVGELCALGERIAVAELPDNLLNRR